MSPAMPSETASNTRPAQRERGARRMKSSSMRCIQTPFELAALLTGERELPVPECLSLPGLVQIGEMSGIKLPLCTDDDARHRLREPQERAFALQDLGQHVAPSPVGA